MAGGQDSNSNAKNVARSGLTRVESIDKTRQSSVSSLTLMNGEMEDQIRNLPAFASDLERNDETHDSGATNMVFTGSGDSYAASLFAHHLSRGLSLAADPSDLTQAPGVCKDKIIFITSVSGRTRANILLAKRVRRIARRRVAITANPLSPLARECDDIVRLPYKGKETITPGTLSFTLSLLAVASRIRRLPSLRNLKLMSARSAEWTKRLESSPIADFLFIGSGIGYALAAYGAFKIQEVLGEHAEYMHAEQLGHSKLFSMQKTDNIVCVAAGGDRKTADVSRVLAKNGFSTHLLTGHAREPVIAGLEAAFSLQQLAQSLAKMRGLSEVAFLSDRKRLALSNQLIY
jgi:fructoselysine-6-P-deglycase FrlB-like protein